MRCWRGKHRRAHIIIIIIAVVLGILAFAAYHWGDDDISGWIENAGLEPDSSASRTRHYSLPAGPFPYLINQPNRCPEGEAPPFLVLLITVEAHQVERRDAIRRTWGGESPGAPGARVVRLFLLGAKGEEGEPPGRRLQRQRTVESESLRHGDILQQDFMDTYRNLTLKTLMGLNWVARHCPRASYVMKTDSDVFVNTEYLVRELLRPEVKPRKKLFTGLVLQGKRPIRDKVQKHYVSKEEYPSETYPEYCNGPGYVFSGDLATEIYGASLSVPRLSMEDVYVGMCLDRLGIRITPPPNRSLFRNGLRFREGLRYLFRDRYSLLVNSHPVTPTEMLDYWHRLHPEAPLPATPTTHSHPQDGKPVTFLGRI